MNEVEVIKQALYNISPNFRLTLTPDNGGIDLIYWGDGNPITVYRWSNDTFGFRLADNEEEFAEDIAGIAKKWYEENIDDE